MLANLATDNKQVIFMNIKSGQLLFSMTTKIISHHQVTHFKIQSKILFSCSGNMILKNNKIFPDSERNKNF